MTAHANLAAESSPARRQAWVRPALADSLFIVLAVAFSLALYVFRLGFYSDDWIFLSLLRGSADQSLAGLWAALYDGDVVIRQRPVQMLYLVLAYRLFGLSSPGYHLINSAVLAGSGLLLYLSMRAMRCARFLAVAVALVYVLLPHYSTDRFWVAAHQATISMLFYFLSLYADARALRDWPAGFGLWRLVSLAALLLSGLAYEVALPLFLLNPLAAWYAARRQPGARAARRSAILLLAGNWIALAGVVVFKAAVTVRADAGLDMLPHLLGLVTGSLRVNFGTYGLGLPYVVGWIIAHNRSGLLAGAGVLGLLVFVYLNRAVGPSSTTLPGRRAWAALIGLGLLVFALGHAIFAASTDIWFTSTSLGNRVAIAAAVGVALVFVAACGWAAAWLPGAQTGRQAFCLCVALLCAAGFLVNNTLAQFWIGAYQQQQRIVSDIRLTLPDLPARSTLILDGVCLEHGGAYAFTGKRDVAALLQMAYADPNLWATAITTTPRVEPGQLSVFTYRDWDSYPYGDTLLVYNDRQKEAHRLADLSAAQQYFQASGFVPERDCPPGFAWGWNTP